MVTLHSVKGSTMAELSGYTAQEQVLVSEEREWEVQTGLNLIQGLYITLCAIFTRLLTHVVFVISQ